MPRTLTRQSDWIPPLADASESGREPERAAERRAVRAWSAALVFLCVGTLWLQFRHIDSTLPYPLHGDEAAIAGPAHRTLDTGTLHPYTFNYPSLPKYLAAVGMAVGYLRGASNLEIREIRTLGNMDYPYYETRRVMGTARQLFALLAVIALAATGLSAWLAFRQPVTIFLAPLILLTSPLFFFQSWTYLNVDIVGTCFVTLTIAACLIATRRPSFHQAAVVPGIYAGLATGSKYNLALVVLPALFTVGLYLKAGRRMWGWLAAMAATVAAFIIVVPYSLIDISAFLNGVGAEVWHYASGHRGFNEEPGLPQLLYYVRLLASEFGVAVLLAAMGLVLYARADWRRAAVLAVYPTALLWLLASQRVHFPRNAISLYPFLALFAAFGLVTLHRWVLVLAASRAWIARPIKGRVRALTGLLVLVATVPVWHLFDHMRDRTDSRNKAQVWLQQQIPANWAVVVAEELNFDVRPLEASGHKVAVVDLIHALDADTLNGVRAAVPSPAVIMVPRWGADQRFAGQELADRLNEISHRWPVVQTFGTNPVLVNYSTTTPWGDPAFAIATLR